MSVHKEVKNEGYYYQPLQYQYTETKSKERLMSTRSIETMILSDDSQQRLRLRKKKKNNTTPGHLGGTGAGRAAEESKQNLKFSQMPDLLGGGVRDAAKNEGTTLCEGK